MIRIRTAEYLNRNIVKVAWLVIYLFAYPYVTSKMTAVAIGRNVLLGACVLLAMQPGSFQKNKNGKNGWSGNTIVADEPDVGIVPGIPVLGPTLQDQKAGGEDSCVCVSRNLCDGNYNVIQAGQGLIDERYD